MIEFLSAEKIGSAIRRGEISAREVTAAALERAGENASLNAFVSLFTDRALERADAVDRARMRGETLPPLCGVPFAVKDNLAYAGERTSAASRMLRDYISPFTATAAAKLEAAGAIVIGKCNLDEFGMGDTTRTSFFGPVRNPHDPERVAGGSSGGSAAAVGAGIVPAALGTDTGGSIREPAAYCGTVGLRPTWGAVSRYGLIAYASSLDTVGPITRTVTDAELFFRAMRGKDGFDATVPDFADLPVPTRPRIGVLPCGEAAEENVARAVRALQSAGYRTEELSGDVMPTAAYAPLLYRILSFAEGAENLERYDGVRFGHRAAAKDAGELIARSRSEGFGKVVKTRVLCGTYLTMKDGLPILERARRCRTVLIRELAAVLSRFDVLLFPTVEKAAPRLTDTGATAFLPWSCVSSLCGVPTLTVPLGTLRDGAPAGISLLGGACAESTLFALGRILEEENARKSE